MASPALLRAVRSDVVRNLAQLALDQGWDLYPNGGGHLAAVNPANGRQVVLSRGISGGHGTANVRQAFVRAGLDLRSKSERRQAQRQEARSVQVHLANGAAEVPAPIIGGAHPYVEGASTRLDARGRTLVLCATCGGPANSPRHRQSAVEAQEEAQVAESRVRLEDVHLPEPEDRLAAARHVTLEDLESARYPLAAALATLDATLAPALVALEAAGRTDAAELVRAELVRTPLEEEALAMYRRLADTR